ncbi:hypothetical protein GOODEAATRI_001010, partial [Goodea atripinnis]
LACVEPSRLQSWLTRMTATPPKDTEQLEVVQENRQLLQLLTTHIVRDNSQVGEGVCTVLLSTLIPMATEMLTNGDGTGFPELMAIMATLASAGQGAGHLQLHRAAIDWLTRWYHCHTCKMVDGVGVCTVCAKVCHKDHEISYAKYGSFFCDCGAKEDGSCQVPTLGSQEGAFENVRMNYSGDQGQTIRQLISAHVLRRVAMCVLSSPHGLPFTVLSLTGNPCNEDYLAVCGLKIYDLSVDALSPMYYFLLPSSKIRDATFLFNEEGKNIIVIMSSAGYMYTQIMDESSSAQHGPFYVTNVLEITHDDLKAIERAPSYVEVFGRTMQINLTRARWFDFPFTREEALQADKKLSIFSKIRSVEWSSHLTFCLPEKNKVAALELATLLLSMPTPAGVQQQTKGLLASLHTSRTAYHNHKPRHQMMRAAQRLLMGLRCGPPQLSMEAVWAQRVGVLLSTL